MPNRYVVEKSLGEGAQGVVYLAEDRLMGSRRVAVKVLAAGIERSSVDAWLAMFKREFEVLAGLRHPRLAAVHDFGSTSDGRVFFTRDFVQGDDLLAASFGTSLEEFLSLAVEVCRALRPLHRAGLLHGDIKPPNVIIGKDGVARLIDFSFVRASGSSASRCGTGFYMAPEVIEESPIDVRSDIYSLGAAFYEMVAGRVPFDGPIGEVVAGHLGDARPPLEFSRIGARADAHRCASLASVIERMIARRPEDRFPDIEEVEAALAAVAKGAIVPDPVPPQPVRRASLDAEAGLLEFADAVLARLENPAGRESLFVVEGELGTGKSAVLRSIKWRAQLAGASVLEVRCPGGGGLLDPIAELVRQVADPAGFGSPAGAQASALLSSLERLGGGGPDLDGLSATFSRVLSEVAARGKLLVCVEDADRGAPEALAVIGAAAARAADDVPLAYLVTARAGFDWEARIGRGRRHALFAMDREEIRATAREFFAGVDDEAVDRIMEHTGGNPLFVNTLLSDLYAAGEGLERLERLGPPRRIEAYWRERLAALLPQEVSLLEAAAVLGREASTAALAAVADLDVDRAESIAGGLEIAGWLGREANGLSVSTLPLAREVLSGADPDRLAMLHRRAMEHEPDEARRLLHAAACRETGPLRERGMEVAVGLERMGALFEAASLLRAMEEVLGEEGDVEEIRLALGRVAVARGELREAAAWLEPLTEISDSSLERRARFQLGRARLFARDLDGALEMLDRALELCEEDGEERARVLAETAKVELRRGNPAKARAAAAAGLDLAAKDGVARADLLGLLGNVAVAEGDHARALSLCESAVETARFAKDRRAEAVAMDRLAWAKQQSGDHDGAMEVLAEVVALNRETGDMARLARALQILGDLHWWKEEWSEGLARYEEAGRLVRSVGNTAQSIEARTALAGSLVAVGRFERAALVLSEVEADARRLGFDELALRAIVFEGDLAAFQGRTDEALARWSGALEGLDRLGRGGLCAELELEMAEARLWRGGPADLSEAARLLEAARGRRREDLGRRFEDSLGLVRGQLALARGRFDEGVATLDALIDRLSKRGGSDIAWRAHLAIARALVAQNADVLARKRLREAERILGRLAAGLPAEHRLAFWQDARRAEVRRLLSATTPSSQIALSVVAMNEDGSAIEKEAAALYRVLDFNKRLATEPDLGRLMSAVLDAAIELTGAERGFVLTFTAGKELAVAAAREMGSAPARDPHSQFSRSIAESVLLDGEPVVTIDAVGDERFSEFVSIHELRVRSVACVPVVFRGDPLGVLYLENRLRRGRFDRESLRVLSAFADQVAIAIFQARLLEELRLRGQELEATKRALEEVCARQARDLESQRTDLALAKEQLERVRQRVEGRGDYHGVIGAGPAMRAVFDVMERVKDLDVPVVFVGESGTGKDLLARVLHDVGRRRLGPFVPIACGAVPDTLVEATLFGHVRGAFSGANSDRPGAFAACAGGTLYLDDIGEMPSRMQVDLLRVLQEGCYSPLGSSTSIRTDFRLIASSRDKPELLVERGLLRRDLLYRLQVLAVELPPLRDRTEDIPGLARRIADREAARLKRTAPAISPDALEAMTAQEWPGNVRELEQVLKRALVISDEGTQITAKSLFGPLSLPAAKSRDRRLGRGARDDEERRILEALEASQWNRSKAAQVLKMPRRTFYRRLTRMGLLED